MPYSHETAHIDLNLHCDHLTRKGRGINLSLIEPAHEIMVLFILRKLTIQTRLRSHLLGQDVCFFVGSFV